MLSAAAGKSGRPLYNFMTQLDTATDGLKEREEWRAKLAKLDAVPKPTGEDALRAKDKVRLEREALEKRLEYLDRNAARWQKAMEDLPPKIERLYADAGGGIATIRAAAETYRDQAPKVVAAKADAVEKLLDQFKGDPSRLQGYLDRLRLEALAHALNQAEDIYYVNPSKGPGSAEIRIKITRPIVILKKKEKLEETR